MNAPVSLIELFQQYKNKVYRLAVSITRNEKDAEDVTQNTFMKVMANLSRFRGESNISTWIYRIAYNESLMLLRKRKSRHRLAGSVRRSLENGTQGLFINWSRLPDEEAISREEKEKVERAIARMPIRYRMALLLNGIEGLSLKESADILKLNLNSMKTVVHRARLMLKSEITRRPEGNLSPPAENQPAECSPWMKLIYDYAGGALNSDTRERFDRHIQDCPRCVSFLSSYSKVIKVTHALECTDLPPELTERIENFLHSSR